MNRMLIPAVFILLLAACKPTQTKDQPATLKTDTAKKNYLPVTDYILAEIANVDSFPYRIMRYHTVNGKKDSGIITTAVFDQIAKEFLKTELDSSHFEKNFEENSFVDRSTDLISFTYSTKDSGNGLKRVDVLLSPGQVANKLNSIYMESIERKTESLLISKMSWKARQNLSILHIRKPAGSPETTEQTLVVWDSRD